MQKAYQRINWENTPSTATPLGASNLVPLDSAIDEIDDRVVQHDAEIQQLFTSVSNGKILIASAITDKGIPTDATATFATMATNIGNIPSADEVSYGMIVFNFDMCGDVGINGQAEFINN